MKRTIEGTAGIFSANKENFPRNTVSDLSENLAEKSFCSRQILIELGRNKQVCQIFFRKKIEMPHRKVKKFNAVAVEFLYQN